LLALSLRFETVLPALVFFYSIYFPPTSPFDRLRTDQQDHNIQLIVHLSVGSAALTSLSALITL
jgi:hypothetical protein